MYVQSDDGRVYAVIGATGQELWEYRISTAGASPSWHSSPAVGEGGTVYVESSEEVVHALNGATGQLVWTFPTGGLCVDGSPVIGADGSICVPANVPAGGPSSEMRLYALDPANGRIRWQAGGVADVGYRGPLSPAISAEGVVYQAQSWTGGFWPDLFTVFGLSAMDGATGRQMWSQSLLRVWNASSPAMGSDGTLYVGASDGLYALITASAGGLARSPWPKFRADAQNTGRVRPVTPLRLAISRHENRARIEWTTPAVLQSSDALVPADWQDLREVTSPYDVEPANVQRFYRLRRPRRRGSDRCLRGPGHSSRGPFALPAPAPHSSAVTAGLEPGGVARLVQFTRGQGERLKRRVHLGRGEAAPVQLEEQHRRGEGRPFVAVHERMVAHQSERIGGGQLEQIRLAVGEELAGSGLRGIEQGRVAQPPPTAELGEQPLLQRQNRLPKDPVRFPHFASARRVFRYRRMTPSAASICRTNCSCPSVTGVRRMVPSGASVRQRESPAATFSLAIASFGSTTPTELPTLRSLSSKTMSRC